jgi:hypothetical protein
MHDALCRVCTVTQAQYEGSLTQWVIELQALLRSSCPACAEPWGEHALAHPHARMGRVSSCPGMAAKEATA